MPCAIRLRARTARRRRCAGESWTVTPSRRAAISATRSDGTPRDGSRLMASRLLIESSVLEGRVSPREGDQAEVDVEGIEPHPRSPSYGVPPVAGELAADCGSQLGRRHRGEGRRGWRPEQGAAEGLQLRAGHPADDAPVHLRVRPGQVLDGHVSRLCRDDVRAVQPPSRRSVPDQPPVQRLESRGPRRRSVDEYGHEVEVAEGRLIGASGGRSTEVEPHDPQPLQAVRELVEHLLHVCRRGVALRVGHAVSKSHGDQSHGDQSHDD